MARAASARTAACVRARRSSTAHSAVAGKTTSISAATFKTVAAAIAPKATCESPSPIKDRRRSTSVTPSREEHSAISTPATSAYRTKEN